MSFGERCPARTKARAKPSDEKRSVLELDLPRLAVGAASLELFLTASKSPTPDRFSPVMTRVRRDFGHSKHLLASGGYCVPRILGKSASYHLNAIVFCFLKLPIGCQVIKFDQVVAALKDG